MDTEQQTQDLSISYEIGQAQSLSRPLLAIPEYFSN